MRGWGCCARDRARLLSHGWAQLFLIAAAHRRRVSTAPHESIRLIGPVSAEARQGPWERRAARGATLKTRRPHVWT